MRNYFRDIIFPLNITEKALKHIFHKEKRFYYKLEYQRMKVNNLKILSYYNYNRGKKRKISSIIEISK